MHSRHRLNAEANASEGFTLLELLLVLTVLGLIAVQLPRFMHDSPGLRVRGAAASLAADLRLVRSECMRRHVPTTLVLGPHGYSLSPGLAVRNQASGVSFTYVRPEPDMLDRSADRLDFFPDGSASGGTVTIRSGTVSAVLEISWLDGAITARAR